MGSKPVGRGSGQQAVKTLEVRGEEIMVPRIVCAVVATAMLVAATGMTAEPEKEKEKEAALSAAKKWLNIVDEGKYAESWTAASAYLKGVVKQEQLAQGLQAVRNPLGKVISREVSSKTYTTSLPGVPDGEYVVIQFATTFENKKKAVETITPMLEKDGTWRISGYYIK